MSKVITFANCDTTSKTRLYQLLILIEPQISRSMHQVLRYIDRLVYQAKEERNYHIFYCILAGMSVEQRQTLGLGPPSDYFYLTQVNLLEIPHINSPQQLSQRLFLLTCHGSLVSVLILSEHAFEMTCICEPPVKDTAAIGNMMLLRGAGHRLKYMFS